MQGKRFINHKDSLVTEALDGLLALDGGLVRLDGYPYIKVVTRAKLDPRHVAVISGGGSGHEPAHAGFVGQGLLSAAVCGELFASPSVEAVLAAIRAVTGPAGCLLVVKNYTGDRLNFGLAAERARALGLRVETVLVADDIALPAATRARGLAGTLFVHKIAGQLAARGLELDSLALTARAVAADIRSLGVSLESCTLPGQPPTSSLGPDEGELGLGIHGEPGAEKLPLQSVRGIVELMAARLDSALDPSERPLAVLINNLGAVPSIEMSVIAHELLRSQLGPRIELCIGPAPLMTSLDMNGFSLSLLPLDALRREALELPCGPRAWPGVSRPSRVAIRPVPEREQREARPASHDRRTRTIALAVVEALLGAREQLDQLDAKIGDGDTGSTLATAARAIAAQLDHLPLADPAALMMALGDTLAQTMGGSLGVLSSIFFTATGQALGSGHAWPHALISGRDRIGEYGGARLGDRTLLDALTPACEQLAQAGDLAQAAAAARSGAEATATMDRAKAGRAAYLNPDTLAGVQDPGAVAVALVFEAVRDANVA